MDEVLDKVCKDPRKRNIVEMHRAGYTLKEIGRKFHLSRERIRQIILAVVKKAKKYYSGEIKKK